VYCQNTSSPDEVTVSGRGLVCTTPLGVNASPQSDEICNWEMHYGHILGSVKTTLKPKAGLPPPVRAFTDQFSFKPGLNPKEIL
jgi:hypothetical protein